MTLETSDVERFREIVAGRLGLDFDDSRLGFLGEVLRRRIDTTGQSTDGYLAVLAAANGAGELASLAGELTVGETYFFRNVDQFRALSEAVLPERARFRRALRRFRMLSAGCSTGEEPYSLAILTQPWVQAGWDVMIRAVDINPAAIAKAGQGRFSAWALRETPPEIRSQWFRDDGRTPVLDDTIREAVRFELGNLAEDDAQLWAADTYDVVFCRNVMMYFTPETARRLVERIAHALAPGGYLFLGHAETLRGLSQDFGLAHTHGTFYYQRRSDAPGAAGPDPTVTQPTLTSDPASLVAMVDSSDTWVDAIRSASERVQTLAHGRRPETSTSPAVAWDLTVPLRLLREERFLDALDVVAALPPGAAHDADVLLLRSVLLVHAGLLAQAEETCTRLLEIDGTSAGAHYLLALCREGAGDRRAAAEHDRVAVYLDPGFAMPRLHLALLARRDGELTTARRELRQVEVLLQREDPARLLLFGGGFSREALITLARGELLAVGGGS